MTHSLLRLTLASTLAVAASLVAPAASADPAHDDCAKLKAVIEHDEQKLQGDAQGLQGGHIHTLIHASRLVSADSDQMSTDVTGAHVTTPGLAKNAADFAVALHDLSGALKSLIGVLEPIAGKTTLHNGIHQRIQAVTTDIQSHCGGQTPSPDCAALITKMRDFPQDSAGGATGMADRIGAYATQVTALQIKDPALKKDADEWAGIAHDISVGLRGVAAFQASFTSIQQRADNSGNAMKQFCSQHE